MIVIFDIILKEIFEIATKVTIIKRVVLKVINIIVASKTITKTVTNFLKTRLTYLF